MLGKVRNFLKITYLRMRGIQIRGKNLVAYTAIFSFDGDTVIGNQCEIHNFVVIRPAGGKIEIGDRCSLNDFCYVHGKGNVKIGNDVRIGAHTSILSTNHNIGKIDEKISRQGEARKITIIEDDVWIGSGCRILAGVTIGSGCVIGAGAVVNKSTPPNTVFAGVPARMIKERN